MATDWKFKLFVNNTTGKTLKVSSCNLNWGYWDLNDKENRAPIAIEPGSREVLGIKAARGTWTGYQCSCVWSDDSKEGNIGSLALIIDVPFSKKNKSSLESSGLLKIDNWIPLPESGHAFVRTIDLGIVGNTLQVTNDQIQEVPDDESGYQVYSDQITNYNHVVCDWNEFKKVVEKKTYNILEEIPKKYCFPCQTLIGRTPVYTIPKEYWDGLGDPELKNSYQKDAVADEYFAVGIHLVDTDPRKVQSIPKGVEVATEETIEVTSLFKTTLETHFSIKASLNASGTISKIAVALAGVLESEFGIKNITEESVSKMERVKQTVTIGASDKNRLFVQWLFSEAVAIYRRNKDGKVKLIAISEWATQIMDKVYDYE